jgi:hypothetical protein
METNVSETLATVSAIYLENGIPFHAKVIGLPHFLVPWKQAHKEGFLLVVASKN